MQCEKYTQAAFMTLSPDNIFPDNRQESSL